jgi:hypothetical protein
MDTVYYAKEAERLCRDDALNYAFDKTRAEALEALATAKVEDPTTILRLQQKVAAIDEIRAELRNAKHRVNAATSVGTVA